jgi:hypothetical protein
MLAQVCELYSLPHTDDTYVKNVRVQKDKLGRANLSFSFEFLTWF